MKTLSRPSLVILFVLAWAGRADPHQLDELLQATRLDISRDRLVVHLSLTPGASIAPHIAALIDRDADGDVSPAEIEAYAVHVLADVRLTIDGRPWPMTLTKVASPAWDDTREGLGTIRLEAVAQGLASGGHRLVYENTHQPTLSVYSVNALKPNGDDVTVGAQHRDALQHRIELDVEVRSHGLRAAWSASASALIGVLLLLRRAAAGGVRKSGCERGRQLPA